MKRFLVLSFLFVLSVSQMAVGKEILSVKDLKRMSIQANAAISQCELEKAKTILKRVHQKTQEGVDLGKGPFYAEIYDKDGNLVVSSSNSVVEDNCCLYHAEVNTIKKAHEKYKEYNLAPKDLTIYINAEPCIMCAGAIMWSGIKTVYFSVPSKDVERITGFDEGFKPNWIKEFKKRGITVYGNIESDLGKKVLENYVNAGKKYTSQKDKTLDIIFC